MGDALALNVALTWGLNTFTGPQPQSTSRGPTVFYGDPVPPVLFKEKVLYSAWKKVPRVLNKHVFFDHDYNRRSEQEEVKKVLKESEIHFQTPLTRTCVVRNCMCISRHLTFTRDAKW